MREIWKDIIGHPNYQLSNLGGFRSKGRMAVVKNGEKKHYRRKDPKLRKFVDNPKINSLTFQLKRADGKPVTLYAHVEIAKLFVKRETEFQLRVKFKDGNRKNVCSSNLYWD